MAARKPLRVVEGAKRDARVLRNPRMPTAIKTLDVSGEARLLSVEELEAAFKDAARERDDAKAALAAEHALAAKNAAERLALDEKYARYRMDAENRYAALESEARKALPKLEVRIADLDRDLAESRIAAEQLRDDNARLLGDLHEAARELMARDQSAAEVERLRRALAASQGQVAFHKLRDERATARLLALAHRLGDVEAELMERDEDAAIAGAQHELEAYADA